MREFCMRSTSYSVLVFAPFLEFSSTTYVHIIFLAGFSLCATRLIRLPSLILCQFKFDNHLCDRFVFKCILLCHMYIGCTIISIYVWLSFNLFSCTFVHFTIVILT